MKIEKTLDMMQQSLEKGDSGIKADILFHQCIAMATKNQVIAGIVRSLGTTMEDMRVKTLAYPGRLEDVPERAPCDLPCHQRARFRQLLRADEKTFRCGCGDSQRPEQQRRVSYRKRRKRSFLHIRSFLMNID